MLGFNFFKNSPRYITMQEAQVICDQLRADLGAGCPLLVGVFVNEIVGKISLTMEKAGLNFAQLSGDESGEMMRELRGLGFKTIRPRNKSEALADMEYYAPFEPKNERMPTLLLDGFQSGLYGGTGQQANPEVALAVKERTPRLMLAGGLTPENVGGVVQMVQPWGVDVASGVELADQPGRKDSAKVKAFIEAAKGM